MHKRASTKQYREKKFIMNIVRIVCALFVFELFGDFVKCTNNWVDDLTRYIVENSGARQVTFVTNLAESGTTTSALIDEICIKVLERIPVLKINAPKDFDENEPVPPDTDTTSTFFFLVYESPDTASISPLKKFIRTVSITKILHYEPKYLILFVGPVWSDGFKELLESTWKEKLLDLTIIEWVNSKGSQMLRSEDYQFNLPVIHQLNPFKNEYTKRKWTGSNVPLFPNKVSNVWGFPLRIRTIDSEPFTIGKFNEKDEPIEVGGANIILIQTIAHAMNATLKYIRPRYPMDRSKFTNQYDYFHLNAALQRTDLTSFLVAAPSKSPHASLRTRPIIYDTFCAVVPIENKVKGPNFTNLIAAYSLSIVTVTIFRTLSRVLRFPPRTWGAFYITRLFFGVSVTRKPRENVERVVFACLLTISAIYSSSIYTALTDVSLNTIEVKEFKTIQELDESGLKPVIDPANFNQTFYVAQGSLLNLMKKITVTKNSKSMMDCAQRAANERNITCLMDKARATIAVKRSKRGGVERIQISKVCFWSDSFAFQLGGRSPYRSKIDKHIRSMTSAGLIKKLYLTENMEHSGSTKNVEEEIAIEKEKNKTALHQHLLAVTIVGYSISLLVFVIEIIVHRISKYRKSKIQPVYFPYTD